MNNRWQRVDNGWTIDREDNVWGNDQQWMNMDEQMD